MVMTVMVIMVIVMIAVVMILMLMMAVKVNGDVDIMKNHYRSRICIQIVSRYHQY